MRDASTIRQRLSTYYTDDEIERWMSAPHPQLADQAARDVFTPEGIEAVHQIIDRLDADGYL
ncbi:MAG: antitoxin Xre/MbcA/ParS toxin-binding domain-containing protein [Pseudomonadota bacterium]